MSSLEPREPPLTEPSYVQCLFVTGAAIEISQNVMRLVGWVDLPDLGGETDERRIVVRFTMPLEAARRLRTNMSKVMARAR